MAAPAPAAPPTPALWRRAAVHGAYWFLMMAPLGLLLPYYGLYLRENAGLSGRAVGAVFAVMPLAAIATQPFWGVVADRTGLRARILVVLCAGTALGHLALSQAHGFPALLGATALLAVFARSLIPLSLSVSIPALADHPHAFGLVRALGTVGFGAAMFGFPALLGRWQAARGLAPAAGGPSEPALDLLFPCAAALALAAGAAAFAMPARGVVALRADAGEWRSLARNGPFVRVVAACAGGFLFSNGPLELFPLLVREHGGDLGAVRTAWVFMLVPEVLFVALLGTATARLGPRGLLLLGLAANGVRWLASAASPSLAWLQPLQTLHAVVVMGLMLGAPLYLDAVVPPQLRSTAQALLGTVAVGAGGAGSSLLSGALFDTHGVDAPYWVAGVGSLLLAAALPRWLPPIPERRAPRPEPAAVGG